MTPSYPTDTVLTIESIKDIHISLACQHFQVTEDFVEALIVEGVFETQSNTIESWQLDSAQYRLLRRAARLHLDLGINPPGIALALELLAHLESTKRD